MTTRNFYSIAALTVLLSAFNQPSVHAQYVGVLGTHGTVHHAAPVVQTTAAPPAAANWNASRMTVPNSALPNSSRNSLDAAGAAPAAGDHAAVTPRSQVMFATQDRTPVKVNERVHSITTTTRVRTMSMSGY